MRSQEAVVLASNASATVTGLSLAGGRYLIEVVGSSFGTVELKKLGPDGSTYLSINAVYEKADGTGGTAVLHAQTLFSANGAQVVDLPPGGSYELAITSTTAVYATATRIPLE